MKQTLMAAMTAMMPVMKPLFWAAVITFFAGLAGALAGGEGWRRLTGTVGAILFAIGAFFLAAQGMGAWMGAAPSINLGDARQMQFILVPFWQLGLGCLAGGWLLRFLAHLKRRGPVRP